MATAFDTLPYDPSQPSRRAMLGALAVAPMAAAAPAVAMAGEDPHVAWERMLPGLLAEVAAGAGRADDDEALDAAVDRLWAVRDTICLTPARTPAGIAAQIRLAIESAEEGSPLTGQEVEGLRNAIASIERLGGRA